LDICGGKQMSKAVNKLEIKTFGYRRKMLSLAQIFGYGEKIV